MIVITSPTGGYGSGEIYTWGCGTSGQLGLGDDVYKMDIESYSLQIGFKNITPNLVKRGVISNQEDPFVG